MILNNTQANIFKVNGGIADNFANRPAANGSFYIFYSIDTQEIFYDNGAWVLLGSGGGGVVNIYNTDGTLTGNRTLSGANNNLIFADIDTFQTLYANQNTGFFLNNLNTTYYFGYNYGLGFNDNVSNLYFDNTKGFIRFFNFNTNNETLFNISDQTIKSIYNGNDIGLKLDFANVGFYLGYNWQGNPGDFSNISIQGKNIYLQNYDDPNAYLLVYEQDAVNAIIKTNFNNNDIGLKLDFANTTYQFGQITGGNDTYLQIDDNFPNIRTFFAGAAFCDGLDITPGYTIIGYNTQGSSTKLQINTAANYIQTADITGINGLLFDLFNTIYSIGHLTGGNLSNIVIDDSNEQIRTNFGINTNGLLIDMASNYFQFGRIVGGNNTFFAINDGNAYPLEINGTNVLSVTSGGSSGQHLKINVNGVNYKIRLENP